MQWLGTLGIMEVNWPSLIMKFKMGDNLMTLRGDPSLYKSRVSLKTLMKDLQQQGQGVMVEMCYLSTEVGEGDHPPMVSLFVQGLMEKHPKVFVADSRLPPIRDEDHTICLESGTALVNVRPYRYPHF